MDKSSLLKWLGLLCIVGALSAAGLWIDRWLPPLLGFVDAQGPRVQTIANGVQILLWIGAALIGLFAWLRGRPRVPQQPDADPPPPAPAQQISDNRAGGSIITANVGEAAQNVLVGSEGQQINIDRVEQLVVAGQAAQQASTPGDDRLFYGVGRLPRYYVERPAELARLHSALLADANGTVDGVAVTALAGMGGVGKSTLARGLAHMVGRDEALGARFPGGVLWGNLGPEARDASAADGVLREWMSVLRAGDPRDFADPETKARRVAAALHDRPVLLVIDDVWHAAPARVLQGACAPGCGLLITTRSQRIAQALGLNPLPLDVLQLDEALALFQRRLDRPLPSEEQALAAELAERLGRHPLGVELAAAHLALPGRGWHDLLDPLRAQQGHSLTALELDQDERQRSLRLCFELSVQTLEDADRRRYRWLGVLAPEAPFDRSDVAALWRTETDEPESYPAGVTRTLHTLLDAALLEVVSPAADTEDEDGAQNGTAVRYRQHLLLREDALARLEQNNELAAALERHARIYVAVADRAQRADDYGPIAASYAQIEAVLRRGWRAWQPADDAIQGTLTYPQTDAFAHFSSLIFDCENAYWDPAGLYAERLLWLRRAVHAARAAQKRRDEGAHLGNLGLAYASLGQVESAIDYYEQALTIAQEIGDRRGEGIRSWNLGLLLEKEGELAEAAALMQVCVDFEREIGHVDAEAHAARVAQIRQRIGATD